MRSFLMIYAVKYFKMHNTIYVAMYKWNIKIAFENDIN